MYIRFCGFWIWFSEKSGLPQLFVLLLERWLFFWTLKFPERKLGREDTHVAMIVSGRPMLDSHQTDGGLPTRGVIETLVQTLKQLGCLSATAHF